MGFDLTQYNRLLVWFLLCLVFTIPFFSAQNFSPATDEITHLPSGYSYWKTGQITLNPQRPPLVKLAPSFPLLFRDLNFDANDPNLTGPTQNEWKFGSNFLSANDIDKLLLYGRFSVMLISVLLGFYIYKWGSELFGIKAGILSLLLYVFMPNIIAHAQFVTTDIAVTAFSFIAFYYFWRLVKTGRKKELFLSGVFWGLALGSKFSAVVFLPLIAVFIFVYAWYSGKNGLNFKIRNSVKLPIIIAAPVFVILYLAYFLPTDFGFYIKGLQTIYTDWRPDYLFYLNGVFSQNGWWYYFLEAFVIKTPIPALIAFAAAILFYKKIKTDNWSRAIIFLPMIFFAIVTSVKAHDVSVRYIIPAYPFLILWAGGLVELVQNAKIKNQNDSVKIKNLSADWRISKFYILLFTFLTLSIWYIFGTIKIYPDYLAYFNELVGGPKNGYKYLDDSNIEWGQDLKRLAKYQKSNPETKIIYSWRNQDLNYFGLKNFLIADSSGWWREPKGWYAINTFLLIRMQLLSQQMNDPSLNWLDLYKPVDRIGYSFFIYEF